MFYRDFKIKMGIRRVLYWDPYCINPLGGHILGMYTWCICIIDNGFQLQKTRTLVLSVEASPGEPESDSGMTNSNGTWCQYPRGIEYCINNHLVVIELYMAIARLWSASTHKSKSSMMTTRFYMYHLVVHTYIHG